MFLASETRYVQTGSICSNMNAFGRVTVEADGVWVRVKCPVAALPISAAAVSCCKPESGPSKILPLTDAHFDCRKGFSEAKRALSEFTWERERRQTNLESGFAVS